VIRDDVTKQQETLQKDLIISRNEQIIQAFPMRLWNLDTRWNGNMHTTCGGIGKENGPSKSIIIRGRREDMKSNKGKKKKMKTKRKGQVDSMIKVGAAEQE
jgi:hypothetical protein